MTRTGQHRRCISAIPWLGAMLVSTLIGTPLALAQTYTYQVLHSFTRADGSQPWGGLVRDAAGNLYGTTANGGASGDNGVVFKLDTAGTETVLHSFTGGADGRYPLAGLIRDSAGNLYGTTQYGGASLFNGVVFKVDTSGTETVLYNFTGGADGGGPTAGVIRDSAGNLYGTTEYGGINTNRGGGGVVFKLDTSGTETVLYSFTGGADGGYPQGGLIRGPAGNLFGTTTGGGSARSRGVVFKLDTSGTETVLHTFRGPDGWLPAAGLIGDSAGNLYGTTINGVGLNTGVVFKLDSTGETVLHSFTGGADGGGPYAGLIRDSAGNLYGTTFFGGTSGTGVVFKLDTLGTETVLYSFTGGTDGRFPRAGLIRDSAGNLYGTTTLGGASGNGVVFKLTPSSN